MSNTCFESNYILGIESNIKKQIFSSYIRPIAGKFLEYFDIHEYSFIEASSQITHIDFKEKNIGFDYFYLNIMADAVKSDNSVKVETKVCITFDKRVCNRLHLESGRYFNTLAIGGRDVVFFILFSLDEIYDYMYSQPLVKS